MQSAHAPVRIKPHPRGHIASCNGKVSNIGVRIEHNVIPESAVQTAAVFQDWSRMEMERKAQELAKFQKNVKSRVLEKEKAKQQQLVADSTKRVQSEQRAAEKAVNLDRIKTQQSVVVGQDIEDVKVVASGKDTHVLHQSGKPSSSQLARKNLLLQKSSTSIDDMPSSVRKQPHKLRSEYTPIVNSTNVHHQQPHSGADQTQGTFPKGPSKQTTISPKTSLRRYTPPGQLMHEQKKQAGLQYLLFRRLYSDLEREQARQKHLQKVHTRHVDQLKRRKESERRIVEDEMNALDSFSSVSTDAMEDHQRAVEWAEIMALEERKQRLQKEREMDRYIQALKARLKEKLDNNQFCVPPLCLCGTSVWDTNPDTCANNCIYYRNPKGYAKALSNLLSSLEISQQL